MKIKPPSIRHAQRLRRARSPWPLRVSLLAFAWVHTGVLALALLSPRSESVSMDSVVEIDRWVVHTKPQTFNEFVEPTHKPSVPTQPTPVTSAIDQDETPSRDHVQQPATAAPSGGAVPSLLATDPVAQFRNALGWAPLDRSRLTRIEPTSLEDSQLAQRDAPLLYEPAVRAHGTPLGEYIDQVERQIAERWLKHDLGVHPKGVGIQGQVTVRYAIRNNGKTQAVRIASSSGVADLDRMALASIPRQLPRIPAGVERESIEHQIVLRYRNPLLNDHATAPRRAGTAGRAR